METSIMIEKRDWTVNEKKKLMDQIHQMDKYEQIEIFRILQKDMVKYTENQNGIFINIQHIKQDTLDNLYSFVQYAIKQRSILDERQKIVEKECQNYRVVPSMEEEGEKEVEEVQTNDSTPTPPLEEKKDENLVQMANIPVKFTGVKAKILKNYKDANKKKNNRSKEK